MQNTAQITIIKRNIITEPPTFIELFMRLQAKYRSAGIQTPAEWPMNKPEGRASYWNSQSRERFLAGHDLKEAIARAMARLETMPKPGEKIDFNELIYGQVQ